MFIISVGIFSFPLQRTFRKRVGVCGHQTKQDEAKYLLQGKVELCFVLIYITRAGCIPSFPKLLHEQL